MSQGFYIYDTVDNEVVAFSEAYPGNPRSVYRPVYWRGVNEWRVYVAIVEDAFTYSQGDSIHESEVPSVVLLAHMVNV